MTKRLSVLLFLALLLCAAGVSAEEQKSAESDPFPLNRGSIYAYSDDKIPDVCFFPSDKARWDGYKVMAAHWKKLTDYQKEAFISEAVGEIERNDNVTINIDDPEQVITAMNEGIKALEAEAPATAKDQAMIRFLYDALKGTEMVKPKPELVGPETSQPH
jgi:hypothetical protein